MKMKMATDKKVMPMSMMLTNNVREMPKPWVQIPTNEITR